MRHRWPFITTLALTSAAVAGTSAMAQDASIPCRETACVLSIDWGAGKTSASYPPDRRYGSGDDFESRFKAALAQRGFRFRETPVEGLLVMVVRPRMQERVMCDRVGGLNRDMNCVAMTILAVTFVSPGADVKVPGAIRITNRCASGDIYLTHREFANYAAEMIWYELEGKAAKAERPRVSC